VYAWIQDVPIDAAFYGRITDAIGAEPMPGLLLHVAARLPGGGLRYIDVWESQEACDKVFAERIHPAVDAAFGGARPPVEPTLEVLDVIDLRGAWPQAGEAAQPLRF
jgi:hypothetical protein